MRYLLTLSFILFFRTISASSTTFPDSVRAKIIADTEDQSGQIGSGSNNIDDEEDEILLGIRSVQTEESHKSVGKSRTSEMYYTLQGVPTLHPKPGSIYIYKRKRVIFNQYNKSFSL